MSASVEATNWRWAPLYRYQVEATAALHGTRLVPDPDPDKGLFRLEADSAGALEAAVAHLDRSAATNGAADANDRRAAELEDHARWQAEADRRARLSDAQRDREDARASWAAWSADVRDRARLRPLPPAAPLPAAEIESRRRAAARRRDRDAKARAENRVWVAEWELALAHEAAEGLAPPR